MIFAEMLYIRDRAKWLLDEALYVNHDSSLMLRVAELYQKLFDDLALGDIEGLLDRYDWLVDPFGGAGDLRYLRELLIHYDTDVRPLGFDVEEYELLDEWLDSMLLSRVVREELRFDSSAGFVLFGGRRSFKTFVAGCPDLPALETYSAVELLAASIAKWFFVADRVAHFDFSPLNLRLGYMFSCALCAGYHGVDGCVNCPLARFTGKQYCQFDLMLDATSFELQGSGFDLDYASDVEHFGNFLDSIANLIRFGFNLRNTTYFKES